MKPSAANEPNAGKVVGALVDAIPPGMDLCLPGGQEGLVTALAGHRPDLLVVYGFNWKVTSPALRIPRLGALNIHTSLLPRYRGPAPVLWAIRNGDPEIGITIHRMDNGFDTGPIIAQRGGIPLNDDVTPDRLWTCMEPVMGELLDTAIARVDAGYAGQPQDDARSSYAGFLEPEFGVVNWSHTARQVHNQVRTFRFMGSGRGPVARVRERWVKVLRTSTEPADGALRVECADSPLWIVESATAEPPVSVPQGTD